MSSVADRDARTLPGITVPANPIAPETAAELSPADESVDADRPTASETTQVLHSRVDPDAFDDTIRQLAYAFGMASSSYLRILVVQ